MTQHGDPKVASNQEEIAKYLRHEGKKTARKIGKQISSELKSGDLAPKGAASRAREIWTARAFLDAYNVPYETAPSKPQLTPADVAARARKFTVLVEC